MKKPKLSDVFKEGDVISVEMHKPEKGKFPIARADNGVICFIAPNTKGYFEYNSTWTAEVIKVDEKKLIIKPVECTMTAAANEFELKKKLQQFSKVPIVRKKAKPQYQYHSSTELKKAS